MPALGFQIKCYFFLLVALVIQSNALLGVNTFREFRFDYQWSDEVGGWLKYHAVPTTWDEARMRCHAEGSVLASPLTEEMRDAIVTLVKNKSNKKTPTGKIFTGVHATFSKGDYASIEGTPLLRLAFDWAAGEPDNHENAEQCLMMLISDNGTLGDTCCENVMPYVCYRKDNHMSMTECGTTDLEYFLDHKTGSCYKLHTYALLWPQAYMTCMAEGGYLAIINDDIEHGVVNAIFAKHPDATIFSKYTSQFMMGMHDWGQRGRSYMTIHGQHVDKVYHKWASGQPDSPWRLGNESPENRREYGVNIYRNGQMDDFTTNIPMAFLCEKNPNSLR